MRKLLCRWLGHRWPFYFEHLSGDSWTCTMFATYRCKRCREVQVRWKNVAAGDLGLTILSPWNT